MRSNIDLKDVYWTAGFLDGEGSFNLVGGNYGRSHTIAVTVGQKGRELLDRLQVLYGGAIHQRKTSSKLHVWRLHASRAVGLMLTIYTLMSSRRQAQIRKALKYWRPKTTKTPLLKIYRAIELYRCGIYTAKELGKIYNVYPETIHWWNRKYPRQELLK